MPEQEDDLLKRAEDIIQAAGERSDIKHPLSPPQEAMRYFMGGAYAGEVLVDNKIVEQDGTKQIHLEYMTDRNDMGDLGDLLHYLNAEGFDVIDPHKSKKSKEPQLSGFPDKRIFFIHSGKLFASSSQGMIPIDVQHAISIERPVIVTSDELAASNLFQSVSELPDRSRGRNLFAIFNAAFQKDPSKFEFKSAHIPWAKLSKRADSMDYLMARGDEDELKLLELWFDRFRGKIPAHWGHWAYITEDLERNENLPTEWLDAAVTHHHWRIVKAACEHHKLNEEQLAIVVAQFGENRFRIEDAIGAQKRKSATNEEIEHAMTTAQNEGKKLIFRKLESK